MQAFPLTFYARKAISSCNTISSIGFLSELYCRNNEKARKDSEVAEEMKRGHLVSMSFRVIWKSKCHFHCYSIYKYLFIYIYSDFLTLGKHNDPKWLWPNDPLNVMLEWLFARVCDSSKLLVYEVIMKVYISCTSFVCV